MFKRQFIYLNEVMHSDKHTHSDEPKFLDSGFYSDDIEAHIPKHPAYVMTVGGTASEDLKRTVVLKPEVKVSTNKTTLTTPKRVKKQC